MKLGNNRNEKKCIMCKEFKHINEFREIPQHSNFCLSCFKSKSNDELFEYQNSFDLRSFYKLNLDALSEEEMKKYFDNRSPSPIEFDRDLEIIENDLKMWRGVRNSYDSLQRELIKEAGQEIIQLEIKKDELTEQRNKFVAQIQINKK